MTVGTMKLIALLISLGTLTIRLKDLEKQIKTNFKYGNLR